MKRIDVITTTSSLEGWSVSSYHGVVSCQMVIGANIFTDVFASFRDFFGGAAKGYQRELQRMEVVALTQLKDKALRAGGNVILGLKMDFDEVSGGGKSMFMLSVVGTAATASPMSPECVAQNDLSVSHEVLEYELQRDSFIEKVNKGNWAVNSPSDISRLSQYRIEALELVVDYLVRTVDHEDEALNLSSDYIRGLSPDALKRYLYSLKPVDVNVLKKLFKVISRSLCINYAVAADLAENGDVYQKAIALNLLLMERDSYSSSDVQVFKSLVESLDDFYLNIPELQITKGLMGKEKKIWLCPVCGGKNEAEANSCDNYNCGASAQGVIGGRKSIAAVKAVLNKKIKKLEELLPGNV